MRKNYKFNTPWESDYWMASNGFYCGFNMVEALKSEKGEEGELMHGLPPYNWRKSFLVDEYPASPKDWMLSQGRMTSYFVPIQEGKGMWLDFNKNQDQKYHVAIVVSIQGINAITGLPCKDAQLEQYIEECPKHKKPFGPNRLCEECGFQWPKQNYICTTSTPLGRLWIDGFRAANGAVQQYILTEKTMRGVASNIIGSDRVYAIGVSFFLSKDPKPTPYRDWQNRVFDWFDETPPQGGWGVPTGSAENPLSPITNICVCDNTYDSGGFSKSSCSSSISESNDEEFKNVVSSMVAHHAMDLTRGGGTQSPIQYACDIKGTYGNPNFFSPVHTPMNWQAPAKRYTQVRTKNMEIGAGASIDQLVYDDTEPLDFWREKPEALLYINYCLEEEAVRIIQQGKVSKKGHPQGFLKDVPVGN